MMPRASGRQCGAPSPASAGTTTTPPESGTDARQRLDLARRLDDAEPVAQPLHHRAGDERAALERVARPRRRASTPTVVSSPFCDGTGARAGVHQHERAGAVGALGVAGGEAGLAEQRRLLIAGDARDRDAVGQPGHAARLAVALRRAAHLGQHRARHAEQRRTARRAPVERVQIEQQRARRVRHVGDVRRAAGQPPDEEAVDGAEAELAALGARAQRRRRCRAATAAWCPRSTDRAPGPVRALNSSSCHAAFSSAQTSAVRRSCQTIALCSGLPVARSHTSVVSRWLVMPMAATCAGVDVAARRVQRVGERADRPTAQICLGVVLDPAGLGEVLLELAIAARAQLSASRRARAPSCRWCPDRSRPRSAPSSSPPSSKITSDPLRHCGEHSIAFEVERDHVKLSCSVTFLYSAVPRRCAIASMQSYGTV